MRGASKGHAEAPEPREDPAFGRWSRVELTLQMSVASLVGAVCGIVVGLAISALYVIAALGSASPPVKAVIVIATILLGARLGMFIGATTQDRHRSRQET